VAARNEEVAVSAIASFQVMKRADLPGLVAAEDKFHFLDEQARDVNPDDDIFGWSGYVMMDLVLYLEDVGVDLGESEYRDEAKVLNETFELTYLITSADRKHLPALDSAAFDMDALVAYFNEDDDDFEERPLAMTDGLDALHRLISGLRDDEVLIVNIG
jgi:hypothetical protein